MTAPTTLPDEVQAIVDELTRHPSMLLHHTKAAINAAFDHDLIEASAHSGIDARTQIKHTLYALRGREVLKQADEASRPVYGYRLEIS